MQSLNSQHRFPCLDRRFARGVLLSTTFLLVVCQATAAHAQITGKDLSDPNLTDDERKQATLLWLDKHLADAVLFSKEDTVKIREAVDQMSPRQLQRWLEQTKELDAYIDSPQWQETKRWLRSFLRVQAIYSDKEIEKLKNDVRNADPEQMLTILKRIQSKHEELVWMHQASEKTRAAQVQQRNTMVAQQSAAAQSARSSRSSSSMPLFGSGVAKSQKPSKGYRPPAPLITSNQVARAAVWREVWGGGGWGC